VHVAPWTEEPNAVRDPGIAADVGLARRKEHEVHSSPMLPPGIAPAGRWVLQRGRWVLPPWDCSRGTLVVPDE